MPATQQEARALALALGEVYASQWGELEQLSNQAFDLAIQIADVRGQLDSIWGALSATAQLASVLPEREVVW